MELEIYKAIIFTGLGNSSQLWGSAGVGDNTGRFVFSTPMLRTGTFVLSIALLASPPGLEAKKKKPVTSANQPAAPVGDKAGKKTSLPALPSMDQEEKTLHALNRLTFGPHKGDVEAVSPMGLDQWIDLQLHPEQIPLNPVLEAKLAPFDTLRMTTAEMVRQYPTPQMVKLMLDGRLQFPDDQQTRYSVQKLVARYKRREAADKTGLPGDADMKAASRCPKPGNSTISSARFSRPANRRNRSRSSKLFHQPSNWMCSIRSPMDRVSGSCRHRTSRFAPPNPDL